MRAEEFEALEVGTTALGRLDIGQLLFERERGEGGEGGAAPCFVWLGREWDSALPIWPVLFSLHHNCWFLKIVEISDEILLVIIDIKANIIMEI